MSDEHEYTKVDIYMEADYPASPGIQAPPTPSGAYVSYIIDTPGPKPGDEGLYDGYEVTSVPASSREIVEWQGAHRRYHERVSLAHIRLQEAEKTWREAVRVWTTEIVEAVDEYGPVHEEIESRKAMVEAQDDLLEERRRKGEQLVSEASEEAADAVYGPRHWVFRRTDKGRTLHTVNCRHAVQGEAYDSLSRPMRQAEAQEALAKDHHTTCCGACRPEHRFAKVPQQRSV